MTNEVHSNKQYSIVLFGTSDFAVPIFEAISADNRFCVNAVISKPDTYIGRKKILTATPVSIFARAKNYTLLRPGSLRDSEVITSIQSYMSDIALVVAYGIFLPSDLYNFPRYKTVNVHPSKLPKYRGPSPLQNTILNNDTETAISYMLIDDKVDHGPLLAQYPYVCRTPATTPQLSYELSHLSAQHICDTLVSYMEGKIHTTTQDESQASFTHLITTTQGELSPLTDSSVFLSKIRALAAEPGVYIVMQNGEKLKINSAHSIDECGDVGKFFTYEDSLALYVNDGAIVFDEVQKPGGTWMSGKDFMRGSTDFVTHKKS